MAVVAHGGMFTLGWIDYARKTEQTGFHTPTMTIINFTNQETAQNALRDALDTLTLGGIYLEGVSASNETDDAVTPTEASASVKLDWAMLYQDNVTKKLFVLRVPTPDDDTEALRKPNSVFADFTNAAWIALKTAWAAVVNSPDGNGSVLVDAALWGDKQELTTAKFYELAAKG